MMMEKAYATGGSSVPSPVKPINPSAFGNIEDVRGACDLAAGRVEKMVARLIGDAPPATEPDVAAAGAHGLLGIADLHARDIRHAMQRIADALGRLESHLP